MYPQYQKPKRCWKCGGNKIWTPELNKWICPQCDRSSIPYAHQGYQQQYYQNQAYSNNQYPSQYGYQPYYQHQHHPPTIHYHGPPAPTYQQPYSPYQQPYSPYQNYATYQTNTMYQGMLPGNKTCLYCGNSLREDENICPKCMQRAR